MITLRRRAIGAASIALLVSCLLAAGVQAASFASIRDRGWLRVCAHPDALPFSSQNGSQPGFQLEIAQAIAKNLGVRVNTEWIVFTRHAVTDNPINSATAEICVLTLETLNVDCVTNNSVEERAPAWSPDGTRIAYLCRNPANNIFEICVMNADGTGQTQLTNNSVVDATPTWSPDGEKIVFSRGAALAAQLWLMKANGADQTQLAIPPVPPGTNPGANLLAGWGQLWVGGRGQK